MITFPCLGCRCALEIADESAGAHVKCTSCGTVQVAPGVTFIAPAVAPPSIPSTLTVRMHTRPRSSWATIVGCLAVVAGIGIAGEAIYRLVRLESHADRLQPGADFRDVAVEAIVDMAARFARRWLWERVIAGTLFALLGAAIVKIDCDVPR